MVHTQEGNSSSDEEGEENEGEKKVPYGDHNQNLIKLGLPPLPTVGQVCVQYNLWANKRYGQNYILNLAVTGMSKSTLDFEKQFQGQRGKKPIRLQAAAVVCVVY